MPTKYQGNAQEIKVLDAYIALRRANNMLTNHLNSYLNSHQVTGGQFGVLEALFHVGKLTQQELSRKILSSKGNITMIIDNLEKQGLVKRTAVEHDRRVYLIQLTSKGKTFIGKIVPQHINNITENMSVLSSEELIELKRLCKKVGLSVSAKINQKEN